MVGLLDALAAETAVIVGHDLGGPVAWQAALQRPDRLGSGRSQRTLPASWQCSPDYRHASDG
jgi:pimeloyl-ACP methyl ester carboxylesterase